MNNMPKSAIIRAISSVIVMVLCILSLLNIIPYNIALPISLVILSALNIWTGIDLKKNAPDKKRTANITIFSGIFILGIVVFTVITTILR